MVLEKIGLDSGFDFVQNVQPENPEVEDTWLDTSADPPIAQIYIEEDGKFVWSRTDRGLIDELISSLKKSVANSSQLFETKESEHIIKSIANAAFTGAYDDFSEIDSQNEDKFNFYFEGDELFLSPVSLENEIKAFSDFEYKTVDVLASPSGFDFSEDASKLAISNNSRDNILSLDVPSNDISNANFKIGLKTNDRGNEIISRNQDIVLDYQDIRGMNWADDGNSVVLAAENKNELLQLLLEEPYDINSAYNTIQTDNLSNRTERNNWKSVEFSDNGLVMHAVSDRYIDQFELDEPFMIDTFTYDDSFDLASDMGKPNNKKSYGLRDMKWIDSKNFFVTFYDAGDIVKYKVKKPYDISTARLANAIELRDIQSRSDNPDFRDCTFSSDGEYMHVIDKGDNQIHQFELDEPYNVNTATYTSRTQLSRGSMEALCWDDHGNRLLVSDGGNVYQYSTENEFNIATLSYDNTNYSFSFGNVTGLDWTDNGETLAVQNGGTLYKFSTRAPYEIYSLNERGSINVKGNSGLDISDDGKYAYMARDETNNSFRHYNLYRYRLADGDILNANFDSQASVLHDVFDGSNDSYGEQQARGVAVDSDLDNVYVVSNQYDPNANGQWHQPRIRGYSLAADGRVSGVDPRENRWAPLEHAWSRRQYNTSIDSFDFSQDGSSILIGDSERIAVHQYVLSENYNPSSAEYIEGSIYMERGHDDFSPRGNYRTPNNAYGVLWGKNGNDIWVTDRENIWPFSCTEPYDLSNAHNTIGVSIDGSSADNIRFCNNDSLALIPDHNDQTVYSFNMSEPGNIASGRHRGHIYDFRAFSGYYEDFSWSRDGMHFYASDDSNKAILHFSTDEPYDLLSAKYEGFFRKRDRQNYNNNNRISGVDVFDNGNKAWIYNSTYKLEKPYHIETAKSGDVRIDNNANKEFNGGYFPHYYGNPGFDISDPYDVDFNDDGTRFYTAARGSNFIVQYELDEPYEAYSVNRISGIFDDPSDNTNNPTGVSLAQDGRRMFVSYEHDNTNNNNYIRSYYLGEPYDISTARKYGGHTKTVDRPNSVLLNDKGTKIYELDGDSSNVIREYSINDYNVRESVQSNRIELGHLSSNVQGMSWMEDGNVVAFLDSRDNRVLKVPLAEKYDITSFEGIPGINHRSISDNFYEPVTFRWADSGSRIFVAYQNAGPNNDLIQEFEAENAYSTKKIKPVFSLNTGKNRTGTISSIEFNSDGSEMFVVDRNNNNIYRYRLSRRFNLESAEYIEKAKNTESGSIYDIRFNNDGSRLYEVDPSNNEIYQLELTDNYSISTASYDPSRNASKMFDKVFRLCNINSPRGIDWSDDGSSLFVSDASGNEIINLNVYDEYNLATNYNLSNDLSNPRALHVESDYSHFYTVDNNNSIIEKYEMQNSGDISSANSIDSFSSSEFNDVSGVSLNTSGNKMYVVDRGSASIYEFTLSNAFDISSATLENEISAESGDPWGIDVVDGGNRIVVGDRSSNNVDSYTLASSYDLSTASVEFSLSISELGDLRGVSMSDNGNYLYVMNNNGNIIMYDVDTSFDLNTASFEVSYGYNNGVAIWVGEDILYANNTEGNDSINQFALSEPYDLRTHFTSLDSSDQVGSLSSIEVNYDEPSVIVTDTNRHITHEYTAADISNVESLEKRFGNNIVLDNNLDFVDVDVLPDGSSFVVLDNSDDKLTEYQMNTNNDISSASLSDTFDISNEERTPEGFSFANSGNNLVLVGRNSDSVYEYELSTSYDISTLQINDSLNIQANEYGNEGAAYDVMFADDGDKLLVAGDSQNGIIQYDLDNYYDVSSADVVGYGNTQINVGPNNIRGVFVSDEANRIHYIDNQNNSRVSERLFRNEDYNLNDTDKTIQIDLNQNDRNFNDFGGYETLTWRDDGLEVFFSGEGNISRFRVDNPYDFTTMKFDIFPYDDSNRSNSYRETNPQDGQWVDDGNKFVFLGRSNRNNSGQWLYEFRPDEPYDINSLSAENRYKISENGSPYDFHFSKSGLEIFVIHRTESWDIDKYVLDKPYDISAIDTNASDEEIELPATPSRPRALTFSDDGSAMFIGGQESSIFEYELSIPYNVRSAKVVNRYNVMQSMSEYRKYGSSNATIYSFEWNNDGSSLYVGVAARGYQLLKIDLATNYSLDSVISQNHIELRYRPNGISFIDDASEIIITNNDNNIAVTNYLDTSYDITSMRHKKKNMIGGGSGIAWNDSGSKIFSADRHIQTISIEGTNYKTESLYNEYGEVGISAEYGPRFSNDGTKLVYDSFSVAFLRVPFNPATSRNSYVTRSNNKGARGAAFSNDGTLAYLASDDSDNSLTEYKLGDPFNPLSAKKGANINTNNESGTPSNTLRAVSIGDNKKTVQTTNDGSVYQFDIGNGAVNAELKDRLYAERRVLNGFGPTCADWVKNGTEIHISRDDNNGRVYYAEAEEPYEINSVGEFEAIDLQERTIDLFEDEANNVRNFIWNNDGTKIWITSYPHAWEFKTTDFDLSNLEFVSRVDLEKEFDVRESGFSSIGFRPDTNAFLLLFSGDNNGDLDIGRIGQQDITTSDKRGNTYTTNFNLDRKPRTVFISDVRSGDIIVDYELEDKSGNVVSVSDADVGKPKTVDSIEAGEIEVRANIDAESLDGNAKLESLFVYVR